MLEEREKSPDNQDCNIHFVKVDTAVLTVYILEVSRTWRITSKTFADPRDYARSLATIWCSSYKTTN